MASGWSPPRRRASSPTSMRSQPEELEREPFYTTFLRPNGLGWCVGTTVHSRRAMFSWLDREGP